jgi:GWxTD domain-containing protein
LLHFLWQGTVIAVVFAGLRGLMGRSLSSQGRYVLACLALTAMAIAPPLTFFLIPHEGRALPWSLSVSEWQRFVPGFTGFWLAGVLVFSIRLIGGWRFTARLRSTSHLAPPEWQRTLERAAERIGTSRPVRLLVSSLVEVPTVIGWLRPVILVPVEALTGLPLEHITALLAHEAAHIRRHDYLASILQSIAESVLFYHPAVWWVSGQIRAERELCCDDMAVAASGDVLTYARALAALEMRQAPRTRAVLAANGGSLVKRIRRLIEPAQPAADNLPGAGAAWAMTLLWAVGIGVATVHGAQTPAPLPRAVNLSTTPVTPQPSPFALPLAGHVRNTVLFDPFLAAQLAQPQNRAAANGDAPSVDWREWLDEDVAYIVTGEERNAFLQLTTDEERAHFADQFWLIRDPTPQTFENEFKEEHYRRIAYVNEHFGWGMPGWKTDRGHVYISYGPPDEIEVHPAGAQPYPTEDWRYRYIEGLGNNAVIGFADTSATGEYRLAPGQRDVFGSTSENAGLFRPAELVAALRTQVPSAEFQQVDDAIAKQNENNRLPMKLRLDFLRGTGASIMVNITLRFENQDLQFQTRDGVDKAVVDVFGRITSMTRRPIAVFEPKLQTNMPSDAAQLYRHTMQVYQQSVPLPAGRYRLNILAKDTISGNAHNYEGEIDVPYFDSGKLSASSLVLADVIEKLPTRQIGGAMFAIGDTKVRPRVGNNFTTGEKMGVYLQVYNFTPDPIAQRPVGAIQYEVDKAGSNEKVMDFSEEVGAIPYASTSQVTIQKLLPVATFAPGNYTLKITVSDRTGNQFVHERENFTVTAE